MPCVGSGHENSRRIRQSAENRPHVIGKCDRPGPSRRKVNVFECGIEAAYSLFQPRKMEERLRKVVTFGPLAAIDRLPRLCAIRDVVAEAKLCRADRIEHPPRAPLDAVRDHGGHAMFTGRDGSIRYVEGNGLCRLHCPVNVGGGPATNVLISEAL